MAATRRPFKAIRKPYLLSTVAKDSRTQVNRKNGLWAVQAQNGCVFSEIMEEIRQFCVGTETPNTPTGTSEPPTVQFRTLPSSGKTSWSSISGMARNLILSERHTNGVTVSTALASHGDIDVSVTDNVREEKTSVVVSKIGEPNLYCQHTRVGEAYSGDFDVFGVQPFIRGLLVIDDLRMQSSLGRIIDVGVGHIDQEEIENTGMGTNMFDSELKQVSGAEGDAQNGTRPLVTVAVDFNKFIHSMGDGPCYPSDMSYQTHSHAFDATNVEIDIGNVVELHEPEAVVKHGFISGKEGPCSDSSIVQQVTVIDAFYKQEFGLVYRICKLSNFDGSNPRFDSMFTYNCFLNVGIGDVNFSIGDKFENISPRVQEAEESIRGMRMLQASQPQDPNDSDVRDEDGG
ncbi:hypothetical protein ACLB2K_050321 [Fragaria x ananassa]